MSRYISDSLRTQIEERAGNVCEYCLIPIEETYFGGEIDHIVGIKHGGETVLDNLALACQPCNRNKGSDLGSIRNNVLTRFYNPRTDVWSENFQIDETAEILPLTAIGEVTVRIFRFNDFERVLERQGLIELGLWTIR